jgi:hypothetical protein
LADRTCSLAAAARAAALAAAAFNLFIVARSVAMRPQGKTRNRN